MEILVGETSGFCYGVKRAVDGAIELSEKSTEEIYSLGELVHNKTVLNLLEKRNIKFIDNINSIDSKSLKLIIRAHGIRKDIYKEIKEKNINIIDYTCPNVTKIHEIITQAQNKGYYIFLLGIKNHPETIGNISYCGENYSLISSTEDIKEAIQKLEQTKIRKILVISQTTFSVKKFNEIVQIIKTKLTKQIDILIKNTICNATELRQKETEQIAKKVDMMIIVGGKNSSNTKKLYEISKENCEIVLWVEDKEELDKMILEDVDKVGIMAGASTPKQCVNEIINYFKENSI